MLVVLVGLWLRFLWRFCLLCLLLWVLACVVGLLLLLLLLLAACASAAARGGAISLLACAETRVLARSSRGIEVWFCFRIGFCGVLVAKKCASRRAALVQKHTRALHFASCFSVLSCVCVCVAFRIGLLRCFCRLSTFCACQLRLAFVCQLCAGDGGGGWGGGDDVHANVACVFCFFCCFQCVSHFASVFTVFLPTLDFLCMPA